MALLILIAFIGHFRVGKKQVRLPGQVYFAFGQVKWKFGDPLGK